MGRASGGWLRKPETKTTTQPPVRQPAALQRNDATAAHPPAASPQVKHAPAAGVDPIVRTTPEKYGRAIASDATQGTEVRPPAAAEVPSKAHDVVLGGAGEVVVKSHLRVLRRLRGAALSDGRLHR